MRCPFHELSLKEIGGRLVDAHPVRVPHEVMRVVRNDQLFIWYVKLVESLNQIHGLIEPHIAVIVAVDQKHRRLPSFDV
jgi:hypothetical protein